MAFKSPGHVYSPIQYSYITRGKSISEIITLSLSDILVSPVTVHDILLVKLLTSARACPFVFLSIEDPCNLHTLSTSK